MKVLRGLVLVALLAGCSARVDVNAVSNTSAAGVAPPPGTSVTSGSAGLQIHSHSLAAIVIAGMFIAAAVEHAREPRPMPSFSSFADWFRGPPAPMLAPERAVNEQDCSRPIADPSANLKCR